MILREMLRRESKISNIDGSVGCFVKYLACIAGALMGSHRASDGVRDTGTRAGHRYLA